jgi:hypothetical protein
MTEVGTEVGVVDGRDLRGRGGPRSGLQEGLGAGQNGGPCWAVGVDYIEVGGLGDEVGGDGVAGAVGEGGVAGGEGGRDLGVFGALDENLGDIEGEQVAGVGLLVAVGVVGGRAADEGVDLLLVVGEGEVAGEVDGEAEVDGSGEGDGAAQGNVELGIDFAVGFDVVDAGEPEGEVTSGGVAHGDDAREVDGVGFGYGSEKAEARGGVEEGEGPAAAGVSDAAVFDGPDGDAVLLEGLAEVARVAEVVLGLPPAAVEEDDAGEELVRRGGRGEPEVAELLRAGAVGDAVICGEDGAGEDVHERFFRSWGKCKGEMRGFFAALRMTTQLTVRLTT